MAETYECTEGKEFGCPYNNECKSHKGVIFENNVNSSLVLWYISKNQAMEDEVWIHNNKLYTCHPTDAKRGNTFFMKDLEKYLR